MNTINISAVSASLCITFTQLIFHYAMLLSNWTSTVEQVYFDGAPFFLLPIAVIKHWACLCFLFIQQPTGTTCFLQGEKKTVGQTVSSWLSEYAQFTCVWGLFAYSGSICLCFSAKPTVMRDLIYVFVHFSLYYELSMLSLCVHVKETYLRGRLDCFCTHTVFEHV